MEDGECRAKDQSSYWPAIQTLDTLIADGKEEMYDFSFIDADKISYQKYFERSLCLVRKGGIIAIDNVLWGGKVLDSSDNEPATKAIRDFNQKLYTDDRVSISMIPIGDGPLHWRESCSYCVVEKTVV